MELHYVLIHAKQLRHVLCERAAAAGGLWLYKYIPRYDKFIDDGYAEDLGQLRLMLMERYGQFEMLLIKGFEEVVKRFALPAYPRIINMTPGETFCTRISGELFSAELRGDKVEYVGKWIDGIKEPKTLEEALRGLSEYAQRVDAWVIFKHYANHAFAYLAYPSP